MKKCLCRGLMAVLFVALLFAGGCSDFDEMKGQRLYRQAEFLLEDGDEVAAEAAFLSLVELYPNTQAGEEARTELQRLQQRRELRERQKFTKILNSYQMVFNGYYSMFSEYPSSIEVLDQSGYFFDSEYLAEISPEGFQLYLWLAVDGTGFRVWCAHNDMQTGYLIDEEARRPEAFLREEMVAMLEAGYQEVYQVGRVSVLALR